MSCLRKRWKIKYVRIKCTVCMLMCVCAGYGTLTYFISWDSLLKEIILCITVKDNINMSKYVSCPPLSLIHDSIFVTRKSCSTHRTVTCTIFTCKPRCQRRREKCSDVSTRLMAGNIARRYGRSWTFRCATSISYINHSSIYPSV